MSILVIRFDHQVLQAHPPHTEEVWILVVWSLSISEGFTVPPPFPGRVPWLAGYGRGDAKALPTFSVEKAPGRGFRPTCILSSKLPKVSTQPAATLSQPVGKCHGHRYAFILIPCSGLQGGLAISSGPIARIPVLKERWPCLFFPSGDCPFSM